MKKTFLLSLLVIASVVSFSQFTYKIKADSTRFYNDSCNAELIIENATRNVNGFLYNKGNGRTEFRKPMIKLNDSTYLFGGDTLKLNTINYNFTSGINHTNGLVKLGGALIENTSINTPTNNYLQFITNNTNTGFTSNNSKIHFGANYTSHLGVEQNWSALNIYEKYNTNGENPAFLSMSTPDISKPNGWLFYNYGAWGMVYPRLVTRSNYNAGWSVGFQHIVNMEDDIESPSSYAYMLNVRRSDPNSFGGSQTSNPVTKSKLFIIANAHNTKFAVGNQGQLHLPFYVNNSTEDSVLTTDVSGNVKLKAFNAFGVGGGGSGTVTSVAMSTPSWLTVSGSPITTSGTFAVTAAAGQTANQFLATPDGTTGAVGLRPIVAADIPNLDAGKITTGTIATARLGSGTANNTTYLGGDQAYHSALMSKAISFQAPTASENVTLWYTPVALTITEIAESAQGTSPSVTYNIRYASARNAGSPTNVFASNRTVTNSAGTSVTSFANASIPAGSWIWIITSATSGTVNDFNATIIYRQ